MKNLSFPIVSMLALVATFALGLPFGFMAGVAPSTVGIFWFLAHVAIKFVAVLFFGRLITSLVASLLLNTTVASMFAAMKVKVPNQENLSPVIVICGLGTAVALIFAFAHASSFPLYLYEVLTKGSIGMLIGLVFAIYQSWRAGVMSSSQFAAFYRDPGNNQIVAYVMTMFNVAVFLAMLS